MQLRRDDAARDEAREIKQAVDRGAGLTRQLLAFSRRQATRSRLFALNDVVSGMDTMLRRLIGPEIDLEIRRSGELVNVVADSGQIEKVGLNLVVNARERMPKGGRSPVPADAAALERSDR